MGGVYVRLVERLFLRRLQSCLCMEGLVWYVSAFSLRERYGMGKEGMGWD